MFHYQVIGADHDEDKLVVSGLAEISLNQGERISLDAPAINFTSITRSDNDLTLESISGETIILEDFFLSADGIDFIFSSFNANTLSELIGPDESLQLSQWGEMQQYKTPPVIGEGEHSQELQAKLAKLNAGDLLAYDFKLTHKLPAHAGVDVSVNDREVDASSWLQVVELGSKHFGLFGYLPNTGSENGFKICIEANVDGEKIALEVLDLQIVGRDPNTNVNVMGGAFSGGFGTLATVGGGGMGGDGVVAAMASGGAMIADQNFGRKKAEYIDMSQKKKDDDAAFDDYKKRDDEIVSDVETKQKKGGDEEAVSKSRDEEQVGFNDEEFEAIDTGKILDLSSGDIDGDASDRNLFDSGLPPALPPRFPLFFETGDVIDFNQLNPNFFVLNRDGEFNFFSRGGDDTVYLPEGNQAATRWQEDDTYAGYWPQYTSFFGGAGDDLINGFQIDDKIYGAEGNDTITGGNDNDTLLGEEGHDIIYGASNPYPESPTRIVNYHSGDWSEGYGQFFKENTSLALRTDDWIFGGTGNDTAFGDRGNDTLTGEAGDDVLFGNEENDTLYGAYGVQTDGENPDSIDPTTEAGEAHYEGVDTGADTLYGGEGSDLLKGYHGDDYLDGSNELLSFNQHNAPSILGIDGRDETDVDMLYGGNGDDTLRYRGTADRYDGDSEFDENNSGEKFSGGQDTLDASEYWEGVTINLANAFVGPDQWLDGIDDIVGSTFSDTLVGEHSFDTINGAAVKIAENSHSKYITIGDIDGDGDSDIVSFGASEIHIYTNDGASGISNAIVFGNDVINAAGYSAHTLADIDGDGDLDIIGIDQNNHTLHLFENDGAGNFSDAGVIYTLSDLTNSPDEITAGDFDRDGDIDFLVTDDDDQLELIRNDGAGLVGRDIMADEPTAWDDPEDLIFADIDGDGELDIVASTSNRSVGDPVVTTRGDYDYDTFAMTADLMTYYDTTGESLTNTVVDYDLDGDSDIVHAGTYGVKLWQNGGGEETFTTDTGYKILDSGDFNQDGVMDFLLSRNGQYHIWEMKDSGTDYAIANAGLADSRINAIHKIGNTYAREEGGQFTDLNGDGLLDIIGSQNGDLQWYTGRADFYNGAVNSFYGGAGNDILDGGFGNDVNNLGGGVGGDALFGGQDDDLLYFRTSESSYYGGSGTDTLEARVDFSGTSINIDGATIDMQTGSMGGIEIIEATAYDDIILANKADGLVNTINGYAGDDIIDGGAAADVINAGDGNDTIIYDDDDVQAQISGGLGRDVWDAYGFNIDNASTAGITVSMGDLTDVEILQGSQYGDNITNTNNSLETIFSQDGDDIIYGGNQGELIMGQAGDDTMRGGAGDDRLIGGDGNDHIYYTDNNSTYEGDKTDDRLLDDIHDGMRGGVDTLDASELGAGANIDLEDETTFDGIDDIIGSDYADIIRAEHEFPAVDNTFTLNSTVNSIDSGDGIFFTDLTARAIHTADVNGDGFLDIVASMEYEFILGGVSPFLAWYENDGMGGFSQRQIIGGDNIYQMELIDVNRDGYQDIVFSDYSGTGHIHWYEFNEATGDFNGTATILDNSTTGNGITEVAIYDYDRDGHGDYATIDDSSGAYNLVIREADNNQNPGVWETNLQDSSSTHEFTDISYSDIDGDGLKDLVVSRGAGGDNGATEVDLAWARNTNDGNFDTFNTIANRSLIDGVGAGGSHILADFDNDGDIDVILQNTVDEGSNTYNSWLYLNTDGLGTFETDADATSIGDYHVLDAADIDGDGYTDILVTDYHIPDSMRYAIGFNNGDGTFSYGGYTNINVAVTDGELADINGDGVLDVVLGTESVADGAGLIWIETLVDVENGIVNTIYGGDGDDILDGGFAAGYLDDGTYAADSIYGGSANDVVIYRGNAGFYDGGAGTGDVLRAHSDADGFAINPYGFTFNLEENNRILNFETIEGSSGDDLMYGTDANGDVLKGDAGDDEIYGQGGDDVLEGGEGHDVIVGGDGADIMDGGAGNDLFLMGDDTTYKDTIYGGAGEHDRIVYNNIYHDQDMIVDLDRASGYVDINVTGEIIRDKGTHAGGYYNWDDGLPTPGNETIDLRSGEAFNSNDGVGDKYTIGPLTVDFLETIYDGASDIIRGIEEIITGDGDDIIRDDGNADNTIFSNDGDDFIILEGGSDGVDYVHGGEGQDTVVYEGGQSRTVDLNSGTVKVGDGSDILISIEEIILIGASNDTFYGVGAVDIVADPDEYADVITGYSAGTSLGDEYYERDIELYDIDGDGDLDVIATSAGDNEINFYMNQTDPGTGDPLTGFVNNDTLKFTQADSLDGITDIDLGDINRDGHADMLVSAKDIGDIILMTHDGTSNYTNSNYTYSAVYSKTNATDGADGTLEKARFADMDNDGDLDIVAQFSGSLGSMWFENTNDGSAPFIEHTIVGGNQGGTGMMLADIDLDGDMDVLSSTVYGGNGSLSIHLNDGFGNFATTFALPDVFPGVNVRDIQVADMNADGDMDIVLATDTPIGDALVVYEHIGSGFSTGNYTQTVFIQTGGSIDDIEIVDFDRDTQFAPTLTVGDLDIIANGVFYENTGNDGNSYAQFSASDTIDANITGDTEAGDINEDGFMDLITSYDDGDNTPGGTGFTWYTAEHSAQNDTVDVGLNDDYVDGGGGYDTFYGGEGNDSFVFRGNGTTYDGGINHDTIDASVISNAVAINLTLGNFLGIEVAMGGAGMDTLYGDSNANTDESLHGGGGGAIL